MAAYIEEKKVSYPEFSFVNFNGIEKNLTGSVLIYINQIGLECDELLNKKSMSLNISYLSTKEVADKKTFFTKLFDGKLFAGASVVGGVFKCIILHEEWVKKITSSNVEEIFLKFGGKNRRLTETVDIETFSKFEYDKIVRSNYSNWGSKK